MLMIFDFSNNSTSVGVPLIFSKNILAKTLIFILQKSPAGVSKVCGVDLGRVAPDHSEWRTAAVFSALHQDGKATLLLDYCNIFFDPDKWGVGRINAGDVITMEYRGGELLIQESYPGTVVTKDIEIIDISVGRAEVIELEVKKAGNAIALFEKSGEITSLLTASASLTRRIVLEDESFEDISEKHAGSTVYATGHRDGASFTVNAYYGFNPAAAE